MSFQTPQTDADCIRRVFRLNTEHIAYVRFIVEGYEGLAQVTSEKSQSEMEWLIPSSREQEAENLASALFIEVGLELIPSECGFIHPL